MPPLRSWSIMLKPPAVLMPGMAGGAKAKTRASGICEKRRVERADDALRRSALVSSARPTA